MIFFKLSIPEDSIYVVGNAPAMRVCTPVLQMSIPLLASSCFMPDLGA